MDWSQIWPVIVILVGGSSVVTVGMQELGKYRSGVASAERSDNNDLKATADRAIARRERAIAWQEWSDTYRRLIMENASRWRRIAIEHGVSEELLGPWPEPPTRPEE